MRLGSPRQRGCTSCRQSCRLFSSGCPSAESQVRARRTSKEAPRARRDLGIRSLTPTTITTPLGHTLGAAISDRLLHGPWPPIPNQRRRLLPLLTCVLPPFRLSLLALLLTYLHVTYSNSRSLHCVTICSVQRAAPTALAKPSGPRAASQSPGEAGETIILNQPQQQEAEE